MKAGLIKRVWSRVTLPVELIINSARAWKEEYVSKGRSTVIGSANMEKAGYSWCGSTLHMKGVEIQVTDSAHNITFI